MLGPIVCATVIAPDVDELTPAYCDAFDFVVISDAAVSAGLARSWGWPELAGARTRLIGHTPGAPGAVRLLEAPADPDQRPLLRPGWRSIELCVRSVRRVRERIEDSPFTVVGEPAPIPGADAILAMQVLGPAGEMLYLTEIGDMGVYDLPTAHRFVERVFIGVVSAPDLDAARAFYEAASGGHDPAGSFTAPIGCVNHVLGLPLDTPHTFCAIQLSGQSLVEVDQHPPAMVSTAPPATRAAPPPGLAMFTFAVDSLAVPGATALAPVWTEPSTPYDGRRTATILGPAGERIELVETAAA